MAEEKCSWVGKGTNFEVLVRRLKMRSEEGRDGRREKQRRPKEEERSWEGEAVA